MIDWSLSPDAERIPGKVSGAWLVKGTRLPVDAILLHADEYSPEEIATEIFQGITPELARRIIAFAKRKSPSVPSGILNSNCWNFKRDRKYRHGRAKTRPPTR